MENLQQEKQKKLDKISKQIEALMTKTVESGCSESEAMSAANLVQKLLDKYDLTLNEVNDRTDDYSEVIIVTRKTTQSNVHYLTNVISEMTGTVNYYFSGSKKAKLPKTYVFYGQKKDIKVAEYLYHLLDNSIQFECNKFKFSETYKFSVQNGKTLIHSFKTGLLSRLLERLQEIVDSRLEYSNSQALVLYNKKDIVEKKFEEKNGKISTRNGNIAPLKSKDAFMEGIDAAENININRGVEGKVKQNKQLNI